MKNIIKTLLVAMIVAMVVMALVACDFNQPKEEPKVDPCPNGHTMETFGEDLPTCTEDGLSAGVVCTVCGYAERTRFPIPAKGHKMADATCEDPSTCTVCGYTEGEALGHDMANVEALEPTCTAEGYTAHLDCSRCDYTEGKEDIEALGHDLVDVGGKSATCTEDGYTAHKACECGYTEGYETIEATGHDYDHVVTAPTCTEAGYTTHTCAFCDDTYTDTEVEALGGHIPGAEATCTTAQVCTVCNEVLVAKLGHVDANLDVECDREGCTSKVAPPADSVLSAYTANCLGSKLSVDAYYYVVGTIVEVLDQKNGIFLVDDGTGETFYFRLPKNADGVSHASWEIKLTLGDKVQIYGKINKYSTTAAPNGQYYPAMQSPVVTLLEQHEHDFTSSPADCSDPAYCVCGQSYGDPLGCFDADANDICDDCGKNVNYTYEYIEIRTDNESGIIDTTAGTYTWGNDNFLVYVEKGTSSQLYSTAKDHMRVYKGNNFVLVNKNGLAVKTITVYLTNATQVGNFEKFLTGYTYVKNEENFTITFEVSALETLTLANSGSTTQIKGVEFGYEKPADPALSNAVLDCTTKDNRVSFSTEEQVWSQNGITLTLKRGEGSAYSDKAPIEFWAKGSLTLEGSGIKTIVIETGNTTYGTYVSNCFNGQPGVASVSAKSGVVTIVLREEVDSFTIESLAKQGKIKTITINPEA